MTIGLTAQRIEASISTATASTPVITSEALSNNNIEKRIDSVRDQVLQIIRRQMPIKTLFKPELKLDLNLFIKDQMLMFHVAKSLDVLTREISSTETDDEAVTHPVDAEAVAKHFEDTLLLEEIKKLLSPRSNELSIFYSACADAINGPISSNNLEEALECRIYTLKLAFFAQTKPEIIRMGQAQQKTTLQSLEKIRQEGANFIRHSLSAYLNALKASSESSSFEEQLQTVSEQLIPFVQQVTRDYLRENGKICPDNPLTFRNPTGYNHHGLTAATIMEVCLKAMGYTTKLMGRSDLEPKVTLATAHNVVMVIAENGVRYLVDPSYIQFHKDICIDSSLLPTNPILILAEGAEEAYIERTIISQWKDNQESFQEGNSATKESLERNGQILPYIIDQINLPLNTRPRDVCGWVTDAFARVWGLPGYQPIIFNRSFHEIFHGTGRVRNTYEMIKTMKIDQLTDRLSLTEVEERLKTLKKNPALHGKNSHEALSLISQLPKDSRKNYISLLDCDSRLQRYSGMDASLSVYLRSLKKVVNPEGKDLKVVYGCSGADSTTVLLATDAQDLTFVDLTRLSYDSFKQALDLIRRNDPLTNHAIQQRFNEDSFLTMRANYGGTSSGCKEDGSHEMKEIALKLMFELREIGVNLQDVTIEHLEQDKAIRIEFPWSYQEGQSPRRRYLTLLTADITSFESYPSLLKSKLESGIDVFYMKGSIQAPLKYPQFLPYLAQSIHPGGWLMTADKTFLMEAVDPQPCLISNELSFREQETEEITSLKELMQLSMNPLGNIQSLEFYPPHLRHLRNPGSDLSYWSFLTLRQKQEVEREVKP